MVNEDRRVANGLHLQINVFMIESLSTVSAVIVPEFYTVYTGMSGSRKR